MSESVSVWLVQGGLGAYADAFGGVTPDSFRRLLMQVRTRCLPTRTPNDESAIFCA
jgi:hypothetical protein